MQRSERIRRTCGKRIQPDCGLGANSTVVVGWVLTNDRELSSTPGQSKSTYPDGMVNTYTKVRFCVE